ncbi:hypothetical protein SEES8400_06116 [Salmonella enterica subsp. enterica serovar Senftenberg str. ATCC 8400]|nr:hypothetical protein SEES8400_06116 [Salmonella enterica subsp. enterica serovar Senftenberg str. ATCC 8400]
MSRLNNFGDGGLSPLARGTPKGRMHLAVITRFIPAGAGNTSSGELTRRQCAVYPRWRGEHSFQAFLSLKSAGLSPLARGTLSQIVSPF